MDEILGLIPNMIRVNNAKDCIVIYFQDYEKVLVLKSVATSYDTGIVGSTITKIETNYGVLGVAFHWSIQKNGLNPDLYHWFQITTDKPNFFGAAIKDAMTRLPEEDD